MATCPFVVFDIRTLLKSMYMALSDTALRQEGVLLITVKWKSKFRFPLDLHWYLKGKGLLVAAGQHELHFPARFPLTSAWLGGNCYCSYLASADNTGKGWRVEGGLSNAGQWLKS